MSRKHHEVYRPTKNGFRRMKPANRVKMAVEMSSVVTTITPESILGENPGISEVRLVKEARKRFMSGRRAS